MRSSVGSVSRPWRNSERNLAYARSAAGEPASTPRKFGSWPPDARAPRSTGTDPSGAVRSSWIWNLLMEVFIALPRVQEGQEFQRASALTETLAPLLLRLAYG